MLYVLVEEHGAEGTACQTLVTGDALFLIELHNTIFLVDGVCGAPFTALRHAALFAYDGHADNRMRIKDHDPQAAFLRVVDILPADAAGKFTDFATGTSLRDHGKMHRLPPVVLKSINMEKPIFIAERAVDCQKMVGSRFKIQDSRFKKKLFFSFAESRYCLLPALNLPLDLIIMRC
jgi:hypothetical protein